MWKVKIKSGIWDLELMFDDINDAADYISKTVEHSNADITFSINRVKEGAQ